MKAKALLFAAALIALSACNNIFENDSPSDGNSFKKGEKVTIRVSAGEATKVTGTDDGTDINLVWETGDKILVTVGDDSETFTLSTGKGTSTATFTGDMPGSSSKFDIQYPATTPDLSTQTYVEGGKCVYMLAKKVGNFYPGTDLEGIKIGDVTWAPVNCGYDATHTYGLLYQGNTDWNTGTEEAPIKNSDDPCPSGWRVPTYTELNALFGKNEEPPLVDFNNQNGCYFNGTETCTSDMEGNKVFLPAAGYNYESEDSYFNETGYYWASSLLQTNEQGYLYFNDCSAGTGPFETSYFFSVRCVQE